MLTKKKIILFLSATTFFILVVIIGCVSHETGHFIVAKALKFEPQLHYAHTFVHLGQKGDYLSEIYSKHSEEIRHNLPFPGKEKFDIVSKEIERSTFYFQLGGPLQTILTSLIAVSLLFVAKYKKYNLLQNKVVMCMLIGLSAFILRQPVNAGMELLYYFIGRERPFRSDEIKISEYLGLYRWTLTIATAIAGLLVFYIVLRNFIPAQRQVLFVSSCLTGGISGFILWMFYLGPLVLP